MSKKRLTLKQSNFLKKYIENRGNGTKAALEAYDTTDSNTAHAIASENLQKPTIRRAIELALERAGLNDDYISELLRDATVAGIGVKASNADSLRGIDMMIRIKNGYPEKKSTQFSYSVKQTLEKLSINEIKERLVSLNSRTQQLLNDLSGKN